MNCFSDRQSPWLWQDTLRHYLYPQSHRRQTLQIIQQHHLDKTTRTVCIFYISNKKLLCLTLIINILLQVIIIFHKKRWRIHFYKFQQKRFYIYICFILLKIYEAFFYDSLNSNLHQRHSHFYRLLLSQLSRRVYEIEKSFMFK